jgi:transposase
MINESLRCPSCGQFGYVVATGAADLEEFVATICHYCGHVLDRDGLAGCLARGEAERNTPSSNRAWRSPRRSPGRG